MDGIRHWRERRRPYFACRLSRRCLARRGGEAARADAESPQRGGPMDLMQVAKIRVGERSRRDLGDIASLAKSIERLGLLHPIVITKTGELIAGERRLEAFRLLGR